MVIQWLGERCFRLSSDRGVVIAHPHPELAAADEGGIRADVVLLSSGHAADADVPVHEDAFVAYGPGEYEVGGIFVVGVPVPGPTGDPAERDVPTAYAVTLDDVSVCALGPASGPPAQEDVEALGAVDVLLLAIGEAPCLEPARAVEIAGLLEATIIVPVPCPASPGREQDPLTRFVEELGAAPSEPVARITVTRARLPLEPQVLLLSPHG